MGDSSGQMHGILAITQKLNFIENIYKKLNNFEMDGHLHKFLPELSLLSRRVVEGILESGDFLFVVQLIFRPSITMNNS